MQTQRGVVLIVSLVFLLLLSMFAVSSMQNATLQEKMAGSQKQRSESFQMAESLLRIAESSLQAPGFSVTRCATVATCAPPAEALRIKRGSSEGGASGMTWVASLDGFYGIQYVADTEDPANIPRGAEPRSWPLYRITAIGIQGTSRTVLESVHTGERRVLWLQRQ